MRPEKTALGRAGLGLVAAAILVGCGDANDGGTPDHPWESFTTRILHDDSPMRFATANPSDGNEVAGRRPGQPGIHRMRVDGSDLICITCNDPSASNRASYRAARYLPDGKHLVVASDRDRPPDENPILSMLGGEIWLLDRDGLRPQRLTFLDGFARMPAPSRDGSRLYWTQITADTRWHLLFADLIREGDTFRLGTIQEVRVLARETDPPSKVLSRPLAWAEWKYPAPVGDWMTVGATYGGMMNIDTYAVSIEAGEALRLTANPENEEDATWDPSGHGLAIMSGRDYYQARQLLPLPLPPFFDHAVLPFADLVVQEARAVPWGADLFYLGAEGEKAMVRLVQGAPDGYLLEPVEWVGDPSRFFFNMLRSGFSNPTPGVNRLPVGSVEFLGRPDRAEPSGDRPPFLRAASLESYPIEVRPFDPQAIEPAMEVTASGASGQVRLSDHASLDFQKWEGAVRAVFQEFREGDFTITGEVSGHYVVPPQPLDIALNLDLDLSFVDRSGIAYRLEEHWKMADLNISVDVIFERPGNREVRAVEVPILALLSGFE